MTPKRNLLLKIVALCLVLCMCLPLTACNNKKDPDPTDGPGVSGGDTTYNLTVKTQGGAPLAELSVYVYEDDSLQDLIAVLSTDQDGKTSFSYKAGSGYAAVLGNVPAGYKVEKSYPITGENTEIVLPIELVQGDIETASYKLGDVMQDFTFTDMDGKEHTLSALLQQKKAVVLSFWVLDNNMCKMEMGYLQEAYAEYADSIAVLGMNAINQDNEKIRAFAKEFGVTFPMGACDNAWENAMKILGHPTTVIIDRYGIITLMHVGGFKSEVEFKDVFAYFTADDYEQKLIEDYTELLVSEPAQNYNNPVDISGQTSFELTIDPGKIHYLNLHKVANVFMQINNSDVFVEYGGKKFTANGGSVGLMVSAPSTFEPAQLGFGNSGKETITFTVTLSHLAGSQGNPYTLKLGEFSTSVSAGNNQGVYFKYTAAEDGYFSLQCLSISPAVKYGFNVMNLTTSAMRTMEEDGVTDDETGNKAVVMPLNKGEQVSIIICTLPDESNNYPAASFKMLAEFTAGDVEDIVVVEKIPYAVTVTDENGNPIPGVSINLIGTVPEVTEPEVTEPEAADPEVTDPESAEPEVTTPQPNKASLVTDENGIASGRLPKDTYTGSLVIPAGYKVKDVSLELTPEVPFVSVKLDTHIVIMEDYTVRVINENGDPVPGVLITIGSTFGTTDADGVYTVNLEKAEYTVVIGAPEGYYADPISVPFPEGSNVLGITLKEGSGEQSGVTYTVKVVDANGAGLTDILVTFNQDDSPVTMVPVDSTGTATAALMPGDYTVTLTSSGGAALKFDAAQAVLSAEKTETTIYVAADISSSSHESAYWGNYYKISVGSTWVDLNNVLNYNEEFASYMYVFYPSSTGIYRFSVSEGAVLGYHGGVNFPFTASKTTDNEDGYFELTVMDGEFANGNQPSYVIGLASSELSEATITALRVADAPEELPRIEYEPTTEIELFRFTGSGALKYVDLTKTHNIQKNSDGFYYLNGKKLYMNLSNSAPNITISNMLGVIYDPGTGEWGNSSMGTGMKGLVYEGDVVIAIEDFTQCMSDYVRASDPTTGLYPLNDDLIYMVKSCGAYMGWWNSVSPNYLFSSVTGLNTETAWMFAVCTVG